MFKKRSMISLPIILAMALVACNEQAPIGKPMAINSDTVATVNGVKITQSELDAMMQARQTNGQPPTVKASLDDLIGMEVLRQKAVAEKVHKDPQIAGEINQQATNVLVSAYVRQVMEAQPVSDADLKQEYDTRIGGQANKEYKARHILSKTEEDALANQEALKKGADFVKLAEEKSTGPSGPRGGDLGWANPDGFVPEFSQAMQALKPGEYSQKPVETQFGWHVILLEDIRDAQLPNFESVKPQLRRMLVNQRLTDFVTNLRENATVEVMLDKETPEATETPEAAEATEPAAEAEAPETTDESAEEAPEEAPADGEEASTSSEEAPTS